MIDHPPISPTVYISIIRDLVTLIDDANLPLNKVLVRRIQDYGTTEWVKRCTTCWRKLPDQSDENRYEPEVCARCERGIKVLKAHECEAVMSLVLAYPPDDGSAFYPDDEQRERLLHAAEHGQLVDLTSMTDEEFDRHLRDKKD